MLVLGLVDVRVSIMSGGHRALADVLRVAVL